MGFYDIKISFWVLLSMAFNAVMLSAWFCYIFPKYRLPEKLNQQIPFVCIAHILVVICVPIFEAIHKSSEASGHSVAEELVGSMVNSVISTVIGLIAMLPIFIGALLSWKRYPTTQT